LKKRALISVSGLVQGIGFRPFVYRMAAKRGLKGYVKNLGDAGVRIEVNGEEESIKKFLSDIKEEKPPIAMYAELNVVWRNHRSSYSEFTISKSDLKGGRKRISVIPPEISICERCLQNIFDSGDRHYLYPFTCCAICGPRFTTITDIPYDRIRTTMREFPLCENCDLEFFDPLDRRFNAQTICCPVCGPKMTLYDREKIIPLREDPIKKAAGLLKEGFIVAIKGIGGIHIATKVTEDKPLITLRERRTKPNKPFAVMSPRLEEIRKYALVSKAEEELLTSYAKPIVVLKKRSTFPFSEYISPELETIGVMLPYSGIHYLLFHYSHEPALVMTSANFPGEPMEISNEKVTQRLADVVDYFLLHNRKICARCDDSVVRIVDDNSAFLRRSRGYTPTPISLPFSSKKTIVAVGPELMSTSSILRDEKCYLSQHIGDVRSPESLDFLREAIWHLIKLLGAEKIDAIACDLHPLFLSRRVASELSKHFKAPIFEVQHHHAHLASLMVESGVKPEEKIVGITCDGVGFGADGNPWGGEILLADYRKFVRVGHLEPQPMPGGDLCTQMYGRMLQGILYGEVLDDELRDFLLNNCLRGFSRGTLEIQTVFKQLERRINTPFTTSTGRLLDAVSCLLGICYKKTYEGEGALKLEAAAARGKPMDMYVPLQIERWNKKLVLLTSPIVQKFMELLIDGYKSNDLARLFQETLARGIGTIAVRAANELGVKKIGFTGGVAYNDAITKGVRSQVEKEGLLFLRHKRVPSGDGGISFGQAVVASFL
jgi:hydrogenase maturation protein HypF